MPLSYYASSLSDNIGETPEGYLIAKDAVIGRTGWQTYNVGELPGDADALEDLGVDTKNKNAAIDVYRDGREVFDAATIASFEGKPVTDNHPPGATFVDPSNIEDFEYGHVQNVRKGKEPLESGEYPLIADVIIKRKPLLDEVREGKKRELSCGYDYVLARDGDKLVQTAIRGNHVAVVPKGRAGAEARIKDSAPEPATAGVKAEPVAEVPAVAVVLEKSAVTPAGVSSTGKEERKEKPKVSNWRKHIFGLGLKALAATDAKPEELAEAAEAVKEEKKAEDAPEDKKTDDRKADDRKADDRKGEDKKTDDRKGEDRKGEDKRRADDRRAEDRRAKLHDALDRMMDDLGIEETPEGPEEGVEAEDVDLQELRGLLDEYFAEEEEEPEHAGEEEEPSGDEEPEEPFMEPASKAKTGGSARDNFIAPANGGRSPAKDEVKEVLMALKPKIARTKDADVRNAFNAIFSRYSRGSHASNASYGSFAGAARTRARDGAEDRETDRNRRLQEAYDAVRTGKKEGGN